MHRIEPTRRDAVIYLTVEELDSLIATACREAWAACVEEVRIMSNSAGLWGPPPRAYQASIIADRLESCGQLEALFLTRARARVSSAGPPVGGDGDG